MTLTELGAVSSSGRLAANRSARPNHVAVRKKSKVALPYCLLYIWPPMVVKKLNAAAAEALCAGQGVIQGETNC